MSLVHKILRKPFFGRFEVPWVWPANVDQTQWQKVSFASSNGAQLQGLWGDAFKQDGNEAIGTLVLAHPMGKAAKGFWLRYGHAEFYRNHGFNVLIFDANGFGDSEANSFDYPADIFAAGMFAKQRQPHLKLGLVGASFGAGWGLCSMAREGSPYQFAILEAAFPTLPEFWKHYPFAHAALSLSQIVWPSLERNLRPEHKATQVKNQAAVLLIYGDADIYTPPAHGVRLQQAFKAASIDAELLVLPKVEHTFAFRDAEMEYRSNVLRFLKTAMAI